MADIEIAPLSHRLEDDEAESLIKKLATLGVPKLPDAEDDTPHTIGARLSENAMTEFMDRLDAHDLGADIYLPMEFDGRFTIGNFRVASSYALVEVLEEIKDELDIEDKDDSKGDDEDEGETEDEDEDEDEDARQERIIEAQLRRIFTLVADGATESVERNLPLHIQI